jgi:hypothetical protein
MRNVTVRWALALVSAASAVIGACNTSSTTSIGIEQLPSKLVEETCESAVQCGTYPDQATCAGATSMDASMAPLMAEVAAGIVKYDGEAANICVQAMERQTSQCKQSQQGRTTLPPACDNMFVGTVANGAACVNDEECVSGACDRSACTDACCAGTCVVDGSGAGTVPAGIACATNDDCVSGTYCATSEAASVCTAQLDAGQTCDDNTQCVLGTACIMTPDSNGALVCAEPPTTGQPCAAPGVCDSPKDFCDLASLTCQPRLVVGAPCDPAAAGCVAYAYCGAGGTCVARGTVGAACDPPPAVSTCLAGLLCDGGACASAAPPVCSSM